MKEIKMQEKQRKENARKVKENLKDEDLTHLFVKEGDEFEKEDASPSKKRRDPNKVKAQHGRCGFLNGYSSSLSIQCEP